MPFFKGIIAFESKNCHFTTFLYYCFRNFNLQINFAKIYNMRLFFLFAFLAATTVKAQSVDTYLFKVETGKTYTPISGGTNLTSSLVWDEENFKFPLPWTAKIGTNPVSNYSIMTSFVAAPATDTIGVATAFVPFGADLTDRAMTATPVSPIRYQISGTAPNRIFKLEFFNAGFYEELMNYGTLDDSVNFQVWLYETTDIVEFRFGSSFINHASDYFDGVAPYIGYAKNMDLSSGTLEKLYLLKGASAAPGIDSFTAIAPSMSSVSSYPANGTVYRFVPKAVASSIGEVDITGNFKVYPYIVTDRISIEAAEEARMQLLNVSGQLIGNETQLAKGSHSMETNNLPSGNYLIRLITAEGSAVYRFQKQ